MTTPRILIVDDDPIIRHMLRMLLELEKYEVVEAGDGYDALRKVEEFQPDAMILDVMMPNMDGITACETIRAQPHMAHLPIIMLSGKTRPGAAEAGLAAGANVYLYKPMNTIQLLSNLRSLIASPPKSVFAKTFSQTAFSSPSLPN